MTQDTKLLFTARQLTATGSTAAIRAANVNVCIKVKFIPSLNDTANNDRPGDEI